MKVIPLTRDKFTIVDDGDYDRLMEYSWEWVPGTGSRQSTGYAVRKGKKKRGEPRTVQMHREILGVEKDSDVMIDHKDRDSLNNTRDNLRFADTQKNAFNRGKPIMDCTSQYKGVLQRRTGEQRPKKWIARIKFNNRHVELGRFYDEETAAAAYNFASRIFFGRFRHENVGVDELPLGEKKRILSIAKRYIEKYGWYVDTEICRSFLLPGKLPEEGESNESDQA